MLPSHSERKISCVCFAFMRFKIQHSFLAAFALLLILQTAAAQSSDQNLPTAVLSNEINGTVRALDLGDPRLTQHFYAFDGTAGDLIITLSSKNLNGDVDVFTAVTFRPLMKISMYAQTATPEVVKSIYLRSRQILILRVEARSPNDEIGSYHSRFSGSFATFSGGIAVAENTEQGNEGENERKSNVSSVGARIEQPATPTEATTEPPPEETPKASPTPAPRSTRGGRNVRKGTPRSTRNRPAPRTTQAAKIEPPKTEKTEKAEEKKPEEGEEKSGAPVEEKPATPIKTNEPEAPAARASGPHLTIERSDGNRLDRPMSAVRRVVIESGVIVVTLRNGRVERIPMSMIVKMAIEP